MEKYSNMFIISNLDVRIIYEIVSKATDRSDAHVLYSFFTGLFCRVKFTRVRRNSANLIQNDYIQSHNDLRAAKTLHERTSSLEKIIQYLNHDSIIPYYHFIQKI
jgi:hypothetical protein